MISRFESLVASATLCCTIVGCQEQEQRTTVVLTYQVTPDAPATFAAADMDSLVIVVNDRLGRRGRAKAKSNGQLQVEIFGDQNNTELGSLKLRIESLGRLEFRILADPRHSRDKAIIEQAMLAPAGEKEVIVAGEKAAEWVAAEKVELRFENEIDDGTVKRQANGATEILVLMDPYNVTGEYLAAAEKAQDWQGGPAVQISFDREGSMRLQRLTSENKPDLAAPAPYRRLGIILDKRVLSAPKIMARISNSAVISGGRITESDVDAILAIFHAGALPFSIRLVDEQRITN